MNITFSVMAIVFCTMMIGIVWLSKRDFEVKKDVGNIAWASVYAINAVIMLVIMVEFMRETKGIPLGHGIPLYAAFAMAWMLFMYAMVMGAIMTYKLWSVKDDFGLSE